MMLGYLDDAEGTRAAFGERDGNGSCARARSAASTSRRSSAPSPPRPGVREAAVLLVRDRMGERLYAFVAGDAAAVPRHPARVVALDRCRTPPDGSIDREALRRMAAAD